MKILLSKPGLDGHDVGVKVLAHGLKEAGFEVVYTGLRKSIETIVDMAVENKVDAIGLSILSGTHLVLASRMNELMSERNLDVPWFVGGNIPTLDVPKLEEIGANKAFATGSKVEDVVNYFKNENVLAK
ncbi:MAG: cobalamin-dependent protein [Flavobacteriales bacterium]|jgi:methylmalonyl-CoA mutase C-terminal domain/subunit|nr:cobalamin-dependent protein [Flavobacteriales bacterium]